ncbi:hypothetical protein LEMLEM_LOCUS11380 [Lemmus lemmus]
MVPPYGDSPSKVRGRRGGPVPAPTGIWTRNTGQLPRSGEAISPAARATHLLHFGFKVHAGRWRGSVQRPRSPLRGLGRRRRSYTHRALELPQPESPAAGTWNKEALAANGSGAAPGSRQSARAARTFAAGARLPNTAEESSLTPYMPVKIATS